MLLAYWSTLVQDKERLFVTTLWMFSCEIAEQMRTAIVKDTAYVYSSLL